MTDDNTATLAALEQLLAGVRDQAAQNGNQEIARAMSEALALCGTERTVHAAIHVQLQGTLISIRSGRPDDAVALIERAIWIGERWAGARSTHPVHGEAS